MSEMPARGVERIGAPAPDFRLLSAQGAEVGVSDYHGRKLVLWFSKGLF